MRFTHLSPDTLETPLNPPSSGSKLLLRVTLGAITWKFIASSTVLTSGVPRPCSFAINLRWLQLLGFQSCCLEGYKEKTYKDSHQTRCYSLMHTLTNACFKISSANHCIFGMHIQLHLTVVVWAKLMCCGHNTLRHVKGCIVVSNVSLSERIADTYHTTENKSGSIQV